MVMVTEATKQINIFIIRNYFFDQPFYIHLFFVISVYMVINMLLSELNACKR